MGDAAQLRWSDPRVRFVLLDRLDQYLEWLEPQVRHEDREPVRRTRFVVATMLDDADDLGH